MKIIDIIMKVIKTGFSLLNTALAILALFFIYKMLVKMINGSAGIMDIVLPLYLLLIFSFNAISNWKQFPIFVSIAQIILTLLPIPILTLLIGVAIPFGLAVSAEIVPGIDHTSAEPVTKFVDYISYLFYSLGFNIALQAVYERKIKNT